MRLIKFDNTCVIERVTGSDKYSNEIVDKVYEGPCLYEESSVSVSQGVTIYRAMLYIQGKVLAVADDLVKVNGISAVVGDVDIVTMPITREVITKIELKQGVTK
jgi:hypothetical protein